MTVRHEDALFLRCDFRQRADYFANRSFKRSPAIWPLPRCFVHQSPAAPPLALKHSARGTFFGGKVITTAVAARWAWRVKHPGQAEA